VETAEPFESLPFDFESREQADLYDELPLWSAPFGLLLLEHVEMRRDLRILDVAAGTGFLTVELAQRCGGSSVRAVDPWPAAADRLRRRAAALGLERVSVETARVEDLAIAPASFDLAVCNLGINNFDDPEASLRACFGALKPGGRFWLTSNVTGHMREVYDAYRETLRQLGLEHLLPTLEAQERHRGSVATIESALEDAGFDLVEVVERSFRMRFADGSSLLRHVLIRRGFLGGWEGIVPRERRQDVLGALVERLDEIAARSGGLSLSVPMALVGAERPNPQAV